MMTKKYVDVILPLLLPGTLTYSVPVDMATNLRPGCRVIVAIKGRKKYTAIIKDVHDTIAPSPFKIVDVDAVVDTTPVVTPGQMQLWEWIADYYLCTIGEVFKAAVPSRLRPGSETVLVPGDETPDASSLSDREKLIMQLVAENKKTTIQRLDAETRIPALLTTINKMLDRQLIKVKEEVKQQAKARMTTYVRLAARLQDKPLEQTMADELRGNEKQTAFLRKYLDLAAQRDMMLVGKNTLTASIARGGALLKKLLAANVLETIDIPATSLARSNGDIQPPNPLNPMQSNAMQQIEEAFAAKNVCLLHGVTASGKTEIYIHLIAKMLDQGKQVLYMLPEIALTTQITGRLARFFGDRQLVYHSRLTDAERLGIWRRQLSGHPCQLIIGARSAVFLPFTNLGLVIVDEEHEASYKQTEPAPRYNGRDTAIMLARSAGAKTLLGTATPSMETYHNALSGKYGLVEMRQRYSQVQLPAVTVVDLKEEQRRKTMDGQFSPTLIHKLQEALDKGEQAILFQNRRGFAPMMTCHTCGWVPRCDFCDVSLTYHKQQGVLTCHYCGRTVPVPQTCPACGKHKMDSRGFGTERLEEDIRRLFPKASVARLDIDTTRSRHAYETILGDFAEGKTDILVGTQMISKGLDFDNVSVVGIINADNIINYPDFRAQERAFQLMSQVAGRAGRKNRQGSVILQTYSADSPLVKMITDNDYAAMYASEMEERRLFRYPPFYRLVSIYVKHKRPDVAEAAAATLGATLRRIFGDRVLGPDKPPVSKVQTYHIRKTIVHLENGMNIPYAKRHIRQACAAVQGMDGFASASIYCDVDPC